MNAEFKCDADLGRDEWRMEINEGYQVVVELDLWRNKFELKCRSAEGGELMNISE